MAHHGSVEAPEEHSEELRNARGIRERESDEETQVGDDVNHASGVRVDPEKGKDKHVVDWYGPEDPAVRTTSYPFFPNATELMNQYRIPAIGRAPKSSSLPSKSASSPSLYTLALQSTHRVLWTWSACLASHRCRRRWALRYTLPDMVLDQLSGVR
jgi:hypothetical protein